MIDRQIILRDLQLEAYMNIILGRPIEEFDRFVENWLQLGEIRSRRKLTHGSEPM